MLNHNLLFVLEHLKKYVEMVEDSISSHILKEFCKDPYGIEFSYILMEAGGMNLPKVPLFSLIEKNINEN